MPDTLTKSELMGIEILIVEDSPTQSLQLQYLLDNNGYRVTAAANGRQALAILANFKPKIIISDIVMPEMDGYSLCQAIKADPNLADIPVILVTSLTDLQGIVKGLECGADNFIRKPYDEKYLLSRVNYLLINRVLRKTERVQMGMEIYLLGKRHCITVERQQILDLLISMYEEAVHMNAELEIRQQELADSNQTLTSLYLIADGLNRAVSEQEVIDKSITCAMELPEVECCWIVLHDSNHGFRLSGSRNLTSTPASPCFPEGNCHCHRQLLSEKLTTASRINDCRFVQSFAKEADLNVKHISIPIRINNRLMGALNLLQADKQAHRSDELQTMQGIGNQIAMALIRAQMHGQLEQLVKHKSAALTAEIDEHLRTEQALRKTEGRLESILDSITDAIWSISADTLQLQYLNPAAERIYGRPLADFFSNPDLWFDVVYPEDKPSVRQYSNRLLSSVAGSIEYRIIKPNGEIRWLYDRAQLIFDDNGKPLRIDGITTDITTRKQQQTSILRLNRIYAVLSGINTSIVHIRDRQELLTEACKIATDAGGFSLAWIGMIDGISGLITPVAHAGLNEEIFNDLNILSVSEYPGIGEITAFDVAKPQAFICNNVNADAPTGDWQQSMIARKLQSVAGFPILVMDQMIGVVFLYASEQNFFDAQEIKLLEEVADDIGYALENIEKERQLNYLACYDPLTDLPNRTLLIDRLGQLLPKMKLIHQNLAVLQLDIDRFKIINDSLGYQAGDTLLKKVAQRLNKSIHSDWSLSRGIGDEFNIALSNIDDLADIAKFISEMLEPALCQPFDINNTELRIAFKIGISVFPGDADTPELLLKHAEIALDKAKHSKHSFLFYLPEMNASVSKLLTIENKLRKAIESNEFVLHYQPKLDIRSGRICGMEALLRWHDPEHGMVMPMDFIPVLEETGMILPVGLWVIENVFRQQRRWRERGWAVPPVAVNVSSLQLAQEGFVASVQALIEEYAITGSHIEFEITESVIMEDVQSCIEKLKILTGLGCEISIDDFGTGYSSLSYLTHLPLSRLKIDKSFISELTTSAQSLTIVSSVIGLAHGLNLKVIAEGVETEAQLNQLKKLKCDEIQGYFAHRPMPLDKLEEILEKELK